MHRVVGILVEKTDRLYRNIKAHHLAAAAIHGDLPQPQRERIMRGFRDGKAGLVISLVNSPAWCPWRKRA